MDAYCTCGTRLVEGARFCHKCGKPQFDEPAEVEAQPAELPAPPAQQPPTPPPADISFRNLAAVRTSFFVASLALAASLIAAMSGSMAIYVLAVMFLTPASGFFAVWLYTRRTGHPLSVRSGAKLGFITGVFGFVFSTVLSTISTISAASRSSIVEQYREQLNRQGLPPEALDQMTRLLESPVTLAMILLIGMALSFLIGTVIASVGGAIGAKVIEKEQ